MSRSIYRALAFLPASAAVLVGTNAHADGPVVDLAVGVGVGEHVTVTESDTNRKVGGLAGMFDARFFSPAGHGGGMRFGGLTEISLFGGTTRRVLTLDPHYAYRFVATAEKGLHVVPTLFAGPALIRQRASFRERCFLGCDDTPPEALHDLDHVGLGASGGASLDVHRGRGFVGADAVGRYVWAVTNPNVQAGYDYMLLLRLGVTVGS